MKWVICIAVGISLSGCATVKKSNKSDLKKQAHAPMHYVAPPGFHRAVDRPASTQMASLWSNSPRSLFGDRRAKNLGDLVTVVIEIDEEAEMENSVDTDRQSAQKFDLGALFGLPEKINGILPAGASLTPGVDLDRSSNMSGSGNIRRGEKLTLRLAAQVVEILPNNYMLLEGRQEIRVNNETRYLMVSGIVRTEDISRLNTITYDKIASARIYYGGDGQISYAVDTKAGNQLLNKIIPF